MVSDTIAQSMSGASLSALDWTSLRHQFLIGLVIRGPLVHYWYQAMEMLFTRAGISQKQQSTTPVVLGKVALDQLVFRYETNTDSAGGAGETARRAWGTRLRLA